MLSRPIPVRRLLIGLSLLLLALWGEAGADAPSAVPSSFLANLLHLVPADYSSRFGNMAVLTGAGGYGFRALPLPLGADLRLTYVMHPLYQEYGLSVRGADTTLRLGRFKNDAPGATQGVGRLEVSHDPRAGVQLSGLWQDGGHLSKLSLGYAGVEGPLRLLTEAGYAAQGDVSAPFAHLDLNAGRAFSQEGAQLVVGGTLRGYLYPQQGQLSADLSVALLLQPAPGLTLNVREFERFVAGDSVIPAFGVARYSQGDLDLVYTTGWRAGLLSLRSVQYHLERVWLEGRTSVNALSATVRLELTPSLALDLTPRKDFARAETGLRAELLFRPAGLPMALGPSLDYAWGADGSRWGLGLVFVGR